MSQTHGYSLECRKLCKTFNINNKTVRVVDEFSYVFQSGKLYVLKGSSGSGKSTLLSLLSLIQECECGEIYLSNQRVDNLDEHEKQLLLLKKFGIVFQDSNLLTGLVVLSCCLHIYSAIGFFSVMDFYRVIYLVLISLFLALRMLTESPTQGNIGFNIMATFFLAFGVEPCLKKTSMGVFTVLVLMCAYELFILRKKLEIT